jgi:hypothetical protein
MESGHPHFLQSALDHTHSLRLTFAYSDGDIRLAGTERVAMIAPAETTARPAGDQAGYWVEVRDSRGDLLYHRPLHDPTRESIEVFGEEPDEPIYRVDNPKHKGEFDVLVPDLPHAAEFSLHGPEPKTKDRYGPSKELLKHDFATLRRAGGGSVDIQEKDEERREESGEEEGRS